MTPHVGAAVQGDSEREIAIRGEPLGRLNRLVWWLASRGSHIATNIARIAFHVELPRGCPRVRMPHPFNIIVNAKTPIGRNVTLYHNVTIGSCQFGGRVGSPQICSDVVIYPGACVIGRVTVRDGAIIGAGAVVTKDVDAGWVVVGNPARCVRPRGPDGVERMR